MFLKLFRFNSNSIDTFVGDSLLHIDKPKCIKGSDLPASLNFTNFRRYHFHNLQRNKGISIPKIKYHKQKLFFIDISELNIQTTLLRSERKTFFAICRFSTNKEKSKSRKSKITGVDKVSNNYVNFNSKKSSSGAEQESEKLDKFRGKKSWQLPLMTLCGGVLIYYFWDRNRTIDKGILTTTQSMDNMKTKIIEMQTNIQEMKQNISALKSHMDSSKTDYEKLNKIDNVADKTKDVDQTLYGVKGNILKSTFEKTLGKTTAKLNWYLENAVKNLANSRPICEIEEGNQRIDPVNMNKTIMSSQVEKLEETLEQPFNKLIMSSKVEKREETLTQPSNEKIMSSEVKKLGETLEQPSNKTIMSSEVKKLEETLTQPFNEKIMSSEVKKLEESLEQPSNETIMSSEVEKLEESLEQPFKPRQIMNNELVGEEGEDIKEKTIEKEDSQRATEDTSYKSFEQFDNLEDYADYVKANVRQGQTVRCWRQFVFGVEQGDRGQVREVKGQVLTVDWQGAGRKDIRCYWVELV